MDDVTTARHISGIILNCGMVNPPRNVVHETAFLHAFGYLKYSDRDWNQINIAGSSAEFYIDPAVSCIGDFDLMIQKRQHLAVTDESTVDCIDANEEADLWKIETSGCPNGYVHLRWIGKRHFNWDTEQLEYVMSNNTKIYLSTSFVNNDNGNGSVCQGPALVHIYEGTFFKSIDLVHYLRHLGWPPAAQSWISRNRNHTWPSNAIVSEVQRNGCDLVPVSHRDYKHDIDQWRYSFSRAEVTLIRSWTPIQQIVYHMLRYFVKLSIISKWKDDDKVICTYHIKTLMLWACERKSPVWWESNCVIVLCSKLLDTLTKWIRKKYVPHYFIPEWNLFDFNMKESRRVDTVEILANTRNLPDWFRINYVSKIFNNERCHHLNDLHKNWKVLYERQQALDGVAAFYRFDREFNNTLQQWIINGISNNILHIIWTYDFHVMEQYEESRYYGTELIMLIWSRNLALDLRCLNLALASLFLAQHISRKKESELSSHERLEVLSEVVLRLSGPNTWNRSKPIPFRQCSKWYFIKGLQLLSTYCTKHSAAFCLWVKTCKRYFKSALGRQDEYSESIHDACHVYLSVLYFVSGTNQEKAIKHCMDAKNGNSFNNVLKPYTVGYSSLLILDTVAVTCGFCSLFSHVVQNQNVMPVNGFTLSAVVLCLIVTYFRRNNANVSIIKYRMDVSELSLTFPCDLCLWAVTAYKYRRTNETEICETSECPSSISNSSANDGEDLQVSIEDSLEETLMKISVEMFTKYNELSCTKLTRFGLPYDCKIVSHFKALYYYRTGEYMKLLNTCNSIISREILLFSAKERKPPKFLTGAPERDLFFVSILFSFQLFFRNDVSFLTGLITLIYREEISRLTSISGSLGGSEMPINWEKVSRLFLIHYLRFQSLIQLKYPKFDIISAISDLKHASSAYFVFEEILILFVGMNMKRMY